MKKLLLLCITLCTLPCLSKFSGAPIFSLEIHVNPREERTHKLIIANMQSTDQYERSDWDVKINFTGFEYDSRTTAKELAQIKVLNQSTTECLEKMKKTKSDTQLMIEKTERFINSPSKKEKKIR